MYQNWVWVFQFTGADHKIRILIDLFNNSIQKKKCVYFTHSCECVISLAGLLIQQTFYLYCIVRLLTVFVRHLANHVSNTKTIFRCFEMFLFFVDIDIIRVLFCFS